MIDLDALEQLATRYHTQSDNCPICDGERETGRFACDSCTRTVASAWVLVAPELLAEIRALRAVGEAAIQAVFGHDPICRVPGDCHMCDLHGAVAAWRRSR